MRIAYQISEEDFLEAQKLYSATSLTRTQRLFRRVMTIAGLVLFIAGAVSLLLPSSEFRNDLVPGTGAGAILILLFWVAPQLGMKKKFAKDKRLQCEIVAEFSESGMDISSRNSSAKISWADCVRYSESANLFLVFQSPQIFNVFPKRAFATGETDEFRQLLNRRLPAPS